MLLGNTAQFKAHGLLEYYSVSLPKKSRQGVSLTLIYLYNLTKNLAAQSAHLNYVVLPKDYEENVYGNVQEIIMKKKRTALYKKRLLSKADSFDAVFFVIN